MDFRVVREKLRLSQPDIAMVVKKAYPGFDVPLVSKVERSHLYGVTFTSGAKKVISNELPDMAKALGWRKDANRTLPGKITFRLSEDEYTRLQAACKRDNETIQAFCRRAVLKELEKEKVSQGRQPRRTHVVGNKSITNIARRREAVKEAQL